MQQLVSIKSGLDRCSLKGKIQHKMPWEQNLPCPFFSLCVCVCLFVRACVFVHVLAFTCVLIKKKKEKAILCDHNGKGGSYTLIENLLSALSIV